MTSTTQVTVAQSRLGNFGPNWFASVMGTGIVATAGATLPIRVPGLMPLTSAATRIWFSAGSGSSTSRTSVANGFVMTA